MSELHELKLGRVEEYDKPREKCGVFGVIGPNEDNQGVRDSYLALVGLQHRGQDGAGIVSWNSKEPRGLDGHGLVADVFNEGKHLEGLQDGKIALAHTRYGTSEGATLQPIVKKDFAITHNGHIEMLSHVDDKKTDTQVLADMIQDKINEGTPFKKALRSELDRIKGAYSLVLSDGENLVGVRDPHGFHPLVLAKDENNRYCFSSEDSILSSINFTLVREVKAGEIVVVDKEGNVESNSLKGAFESDDQHANCAFEHIYFARPDSKIGGSNVQLARERMGAILAKNERDGFEADLVIGVPDSGVPASLGYSEASGLPFKQGITKNRYVTRTFIQANQIDRENAVRMKQHVNADILKGKRVVVIDDSIIRGTTTKALVKMLREEGGVAEIHLRIASPPYKWPCFYGMDTGDPRELIASFKTEEEIRQYVGADSLAYLSVGDVKEAISLKMGNLCMACADGNYPTA